MAHKTVIAHVTAYISDELLPKESIKDTPWQPVPVSVNYVTVHTQLPNSKDCGALVVYYGFKLLIVS